MSDSTVSDSKGFNQPLAGGFDLVYEGAHALQAVMRVVPSHVMDEQMEALLRPILRDLLAALDLLDLGIVQGAQHE